MTYQYGPIIPEEKKLPPKVFSSYLEFDCDIKKINSMIEKFLDSHTPKEDGVTLIPISIAKQTIKNPIDFFIDEEE